MQVFSATLPVVAATQVAMTHADDFVKLGANHVRVTDDGVTLGFSTPAQAQVGRSIIASSIEFADDDGSVAVPITVTGSSADLPSVGIEAAASAIRLLSGVREVSIDPALRRLQVWTSDEKTFPATPMIIRPRVDALLRDEIAGYAVRVESGHPGTGWGGGF